MFNVDALDPDTWGINGVYSTIGELFKSYSWIHVVAHKRIAILCFAATTTNRWSKSTCRKFLNVSNVQFLWFVFGLLQYD